MMCDLLCACACVFTGAFTIALTPMPSGNVLFVPVLSTGLMLACADPATSLDAGNCTATAVSIQPTGVFVLPNNM